MRTSLPPLNALRVFQLAAKYNSFARAAEVLNLTPAAVAYQVKLLEEAIAVKLFDRQARGIKLNRAGLDYWQATSPIVESIAEETARLARQYGEQQNTINLCTLHAIAEKWLLPRLAQYQNEQAAEINTLAVTKISEDDLTQADICISYQTRPGDDFVCVELMRESIVPVCSPQLLEQTDQQAQDILNQSPWLCDINWEQDWQLWQAAHPQLSLKPLQRLNFSLYSLVIDAAVKNMGIAMGRVQLIQPELAEGRLIALANQPLPLPDAYYVFARMEKLQQPHIKALFDWLAT